MTIVNKLTDLAPLDGERMICDFFGGHFVDCFLLKHSPNTFDAIWNNGPTTHQVHINTANSRRNHCFWRDNWGILHYQWITEENHAE